MQFLTRNISFGEIPYFLILEIVTNKAKRYKIHKHCHLTLTSDLHYNNEATSDLSLTITG